MEKVFMCASIITAIILCFVGIVKLPFKTFKEKHPKCYRAFFCALSLVLAVAGPIVAQLFILNGSLACLDFAVLVITTVAGVFGLYTSYEGLGLKTLVQKIVSKFAELMNSYSDSKLAKMVGKVGIDKLNEIDKQMKEKEALAEKEKQEKLAQAQASAEQPK
jgi:hypothetical protein